VDIRDHADKTTGWSYQYLSPANFDLPQAVVRQHVFAPDGPAWKAMVLTNQSDLTVATAQKVGHLAQQGLPIIISGSAGELATGNSSDLITAQEAVTMLRQIENVYMVEDGQVASQLRKLGLVPNVKTVTNGTWYPTWRYDNTTGTGYAYVFCDMLASSGYIEVASAQTPYFLDAWSGRKTPVLNYSTKNGTTVIPLSLAGNQTKIISFSTAHLGPGHRPKIHATSVPPEVVGYNYTSASEWTIHVARPSSSGQASPLTLSNGSTLSTSDVAAGVPASFSVQNWTLVAEHWEAPSNLYDASTIAVKRNTTHSLPSLVSWVDIPALQNVSGVGYYSTSFSLSPNVSGAYISFPPVLQALKISINGHYAGPVDYSAPSVDIGPYLNKTGGRNEITAIVPSSMWNYLRSIFGSLRDQGKPPFALQLLPVLPDLSDNGLIGTVRVTPYTNIVVGA
jgi:hypothetical protein